MFRLTARMQEFASDFDMVVRMLSKKLLPLVIFLAAVVPTFAQKQLSERPCGLHEFAHDTAAESGGVARGLVKIPRNMVKPKNLGWELPVAAATALLITKADQPADRRIQSPSLENTAGIWSNVGWGMEFASSAVAYGVGCHDGDQYLRDTGFKAMAAMGTALVADYGLKLAFNRQYAYNGATSGKFWGGGKSFPSGHSATSFAFASVVAHRYPHKAWVKWGAYALATGVAVSRYPAKKHYLSDILVGSTLGYVTGAYMANH
jgi:hypothetical protein